MRNSLLIFFLFAAGLVINAQPLKRPFIIESRMHAGLNLPFYKALDYLIEENIYSFDISVGLPTYGKDYWEELYNYPETGVGYSFWSLGNNEVMGKAHVIYGYINFPLLRPEHRFSLNYQTSLGGAYMPRIFDIKENHLNRAMGSHLNIYFRLGIDIRLKISPVSSMVMEAGIMHFSNGKTRSPNYGINAGSISLGFNYMFNAEKRGIQTTEFPELSRKYIQSVIFSAGSKTYDDLSGKRYLSSSLSYNIDRFMDHKRKIGLGADFFYDGSIGTALEDNDGMAGKEFITLIRIGLHGSYAIRYKKMIMGVDLGHYLYSKYKILTNIYNRLSIQYVLSKNISANMAIKSHWGKADCMEWGIGYSW